jgi:hypothetical protein
MGVEVAEFSEVRLGHSLWGSVSALHQAHHQALLKSSYAITILQLVQLGFNGAQQFRIPRLL